MSEPAAPAAPPAGSTARAVILRRVWRLIVIAVLLYAMWLTLLVAGQEWFIFAARMRPPLATDGPADANVQQVWLTMQDGEPVEGWYQPGAGRSADAPGPAAIFFHGNGDFVDERWFVSEGYLERGISFLAVEYRGYGRVKGRPSQRAVVSDALEFYDWLAARPEVDAQRILLHGNSLGGGVATQVALRRPAAVLVLESTFASMTDIGRRYLAPPALSRNPFDNVAALRKLDLPVLIVHGHGDWVIPISHARRLHAAARRSHLVETDGGHANYQPAWHELWPFLERHAPQVLGSP